MKQIIISFVIIMTIAISSKGQVTIYKTANDYKSGENLASYEEIRNGKGSKDIIVKDSNKAKTTFSKDKIWGYKTTANGKQIFIRLVEGKSFEVDLITDEIVIYKKHKSSILILGDIIIPDDEIEIYFSKSIDESPIFLEKESIKSAYNLTAKQLQNLEDLHKDKKINKTSRETNDYLILEKVIKLKS